MTIFGQKFWSEANISSSYNSKKNYTVAILPVTSSDASLKDRNELMDAAYNQLSTILTGVKNFQTVNKETVLQACYKYAFGAGNINVSNYKQIATDINANLLVLVQLSKDKRTIKKKEVGTIMAFIQFFDVEANNTVIYSGKGRSINPLSETVEIEMAVEKAMEKMVRLK